MKVRELTIEQKTLLVGQKWNNETFFNPVLDADGKWFISEEEYNALSDEEKAAILADAISKNTLEGALSIAAAAENNAIAQGVVGDSTTD